MAQAFGPDEELRLFFALPLDRQLREAAVQAQRQVDGAGAKIKWVEPENLHFTLKFLGPTPGRAVPDLARVAGQMAQCQAPFAITVGGVGAFPRPDDVRVLWLGCRAGADNLTALALNVERALVTSGLAPRDKKPFRAHLTIGRNKSRHRAAQLARAIGEAADMHIGDMQVTGFALVRSQLTPAGPVYTVLEQFALDAPL